MPKKKSTRSSRTKNEVLAEFQDIQAAMGDLRDPFAKKLSQANAVAARGVASALTIDNVVDVTTNLGLQIQRTLANVTEQLTEKLKELDAVKLAIESEKNELNELHKKDIAATALNLLVTEYQDELKRQDDNRASFTNLCLEDQKNRDKEVREYNEKLKTDREREVSDYNYRTQSERQRELDRHNKIVEDMTKSWQEREKVLSAKEVEYTNLKTQVESFPNMLKAEVDKATAIVGNTMKREHLSEVNFLRKDYEGQLALLKQRIESENLSHTAMLNQIAKLEAQLDAAKQQVSDIATKALESASGQTALQRVTDVVNSREINNRGKS